MASRLLFMAFFFGLISCGQNSNNEKVPTINTKTIVVPKEEWAIYSKQGEIFHVKRLVSIEGELTLLSYEINTSEPEAASQKFDSKRAVTSKNEADSILNASKFNWTPYKSKLTLFVQIEPSVFKSEMEALIKRQEIEQEIEAALKLENLGEWTGGDLGAGGANMLFEVTNFNKAISVILQALSKKDMESKTIIGRRINIESEDWFYEVVYPGTYNGAFLTM